MWDASWGTLRGILQAQSRASDQCGEVQRRLLEEMTPEPNPKAGKHGHGTISCKAVDSSVKTEWVLPIFKNEHRAEERLLFLVFLPFWIFLLASLSHALSPDFPKTVVT